MSSGKAREHLLLESHGVRVEVEVQALELLPEITRILPPGHALVREFPEDGHFTIGGADGQYWVQLDGGEIASGVAADVAVQALDAQLRARIALVAPDVIFVHAGVVAVDGHAIALPGRSFSGKTTLVAALVAAGATYYSDEFAVIASDGAVLPYAKPLSIRSDGDRYGAVTPVESLGGAAGEGPTRLALVADLMYRADADWAPRTLTPGAGALALLSNTVPARTRPAQVLAAASRAIGSAKVIAGDRGEADVTARLLLDELRQAVAAP